MMKRRQYGQIGMLQFCLPVDVSRPDQSLPGRLVSRKGAKEGQKAQSPSLPSLRIGVFAIVRQVTA